jgi:hypothetical protein
VDDQTEAVGRATIGTGRPWHAARCNVVIPAVDPKTKGNLKLEIDVDPQSFL